jgi:ATP-binding cassette, subfamily B, bacterial
MSKEVLKTVSLRQQFGVALFAMRIFWQYSKSLFLLYMGSSVISAITPIANAVIVGKSIGEVAKTINGSASFTQLAFLLGLAAAVNLLASISTSTTNYFISAKRDYLELELSSKLMQAKSTMPLDVLELPETKEMFDRAAKGVNTISWYINDLINITTKIASLIGAGAVIFFTAPLLFLVLLPMPIFGTWARIREYRKFRDVWDRSRSHRMRAYRVEQLFEATTSVLEVRLFDLTKKLLKLWRAEKIKSLDVRRKDERSLAIITTLSQTFESAVGVGADIWVAKGMFDGRFSIAVFEQTRQLIGTFVRSLASISNSFADLPVDGYRVLDYKICIETEHDLFNASRVDAVIESIDLDGVSFSYPGSESLALNRVDISIKKGEHLAIVGQNGAGKTTLLRLLLGMYKPSKGKVLLNNDLDISGHSEYLAGRAAVVMQDFSSFDFMTVGQSVGLADYPKYDKEKTESVLKTVGLYDYIMSLKGLESNYGYVEEDGVKLSGGQDQRLALSRALYTDAEILVMDEPTSMIDAKDEQDIIDAVFEKYTGKTALLVSHRLSTVKRADRIIVVKAGKIVETGTHKELYVEGTDYYDLFHKQAKAYQQD